jgi:hypothetical protein
MNRTLSRSTWSLAAVLLLAACQSDEGLQVPDPPKIVRVEVEKLVAVPEELTRDCGDEKPREQSYGEALRLANARGAYLDECTARMRKIRGLAP